MKQVKSSLCLLLILITGLPAQQKELRLEEAILIGQWQLGSR